MNEFTAKNEQAFLDACGAIGVEPNAMIEPHKERYLVSEFLKDPVSWLETELLYYSYTTPGEVQEVANAIDRMISDRDSVHRVFVGARSSRRGAELLDDPVSQHKGRVVQFYRRKVLDPRGSGRFCRIARRAELGEMTVGFRFRIRIRLGKGIWRLTLARERLAQRRRQRARHEHQ